MSRDGLVTFTVVVPDEAGEHVEEYTMTRAHAEELKARRTAVAAWTSAPTDLFGPDRKGRPAARYDDIIEEDT